MTTRTYSSDDKPSYEAVTTEAKRIKADYKNFAFGLYAGLNSTKLMSENNNGETAGRVGYQAGFFVRGGGRFFGQIGAEYFASSSTYFTKDDALTPREIRDRIDIRYIQVPVYVGVKLLESDRGLSAIRLQVGGEYANRINSKSGEFNLSNSEIKSGTFNALGQVGFDIGPLLIDLTYHHGLSDAIKGSGFNGSTRRIVSASVGLKF
ncbi:MAG: PorT family protein [Verrucomicrobia bacterium]|nr:PorT family protein [Cytophagales bacterium]